MLQISIRLSQSGDLSYDKGESIEHILNSSLDRKGNSYQNMLFLSERLCLEYCVHCWELLFYGVYPVSAPLENWD